MPRKIWTPTAFLTAAAFLGFLLQGCSTESSFSSLEGSSTVTLALHGLQPLPGTLNYQAWLVSGTSTSFYGYPLVLFNMDEDGRMVDPVADTILAGPFQAGLDADAVMGIVVSLELSDQLLAYSSYTFILSGQMEVGGSVELSTDEWLAFEDSFSDVAGGFILASPTDEDPEDELSGIWFMDPSTDPVGPGLLLPDAPEGWGYESWVVLDGQTLSMGKFAYPDVADSANTYSGGLSAPSFPGEDFLTSAPAGLTFPTDLSGASIFVTLEPWAEWDADAEAPFFLRILEAQIPNEAAYQTLYDMLSLTDQFPTGTATVISP